MKRTPHRTGSAQSRRTHSPRARNGRRSRVVLLIEDDPDLRGALDEWPADGPSEARSDSFGAWSADESTAFGGEREYPSLAADDIDDSADAFATVERAIFHGGTVRWH